MNVFTDVFENDSKTKTNNNNQIYLSEIYKELGSETQLPKHQIVDNDIIRTAIEQAYNELGSGRIQPNRLFNILAENGYINIRIGETDISKWSDISDKEFLKMDGIGLGSVKFLRRAIDILNGADPLPKQLYEVKMTFEELSSLRRIYERKQNETELLKRIINNATLVE